MQIQKLEQQQQEKKALMEQEEKAKQPKLSQIYMSEDMRKRIESIIFQLRNSAIQLPTNFKRTKSMDNLAQFLLEERFEYDDIQTALDVVPQEGSDYANNVLDWLCLNIPAERLPLKYGPLRGNLIFISNSGNNNNSKDNNAPLLQNMANQLVLDKFLSVGMSPHIVTEFVDAMEPQEEHTDGHFSLQEQQVLKQAFYTHFGIQDQFVEQETASMVQDTQQVIDDELIALASIYDNQAQLVSSDHCIIRLPSLSEATEGALDSLRVIYCPSLIRYPQQIPVILACSQSITKRHRYDIAENVTRSLLQEVNTQGLLGQPFLFTLISWLDSNIAEVINNINSNQNATPLEINEASGKIATPSTSKQQQNRPSKKNKLSWDRFKPKLENTDRLSIELMNQYEVMQKNPDYQSILAKRQTLPAVKHAQKILQLVESNQVVVITGDTGCGKSTQVPQLILDQLILAGKGGSCNIVCTQPRRIAAISLAQRVAQERVQSPGQQVGYQVRLESVTSTETRLLYCTTGILLRRLQSDPELRQLTHIIIDEVHEFSVEISFLLVIVKRLISTVRKDLKLILMSASINSEMLASYFGCPDQIFNIEGRSFPVKEVYVEDIVKSISYTFDTPKAQPKTLSTHPMEPPTELSNDNEEVTDTTSIYDSTSEINFDLLVAVTEYVVKDIGSGGILVFLPGIAEILQLQKMLKQTLSVVSNVTIFALHSSLTPQEQQRVFDNVKGIKVVLSTNIAETSVTIDDIVAVIDSGKVNQTQFNPRNQMTSLVETWISKANAKQRMGRAGRVRPGTCYRVFTRKKFAELAAQETPEILRVPLQHLCLQIKLMNFGNIQEFLGQSLHPPEKSAIESSIEVLVDFGALTPMDQQLTPLGHHLSLLPTDIYIGKLLIFGAIFRCIDPILTIAATLSAKSPLVTPAEKRQEANAAHQSLAFGKSDHLTWVNIYTQFWAAKKKGKAKEFCKEKYLSEPTLKLIGELRRELAEQLSDIGFLFLKDQKKLCHRDKPREDAIGDGLLDIIGEEFYSNSKSVKVVRAVLCAGFYPNAIFIDNNTKYQLTAHGTIVAANEAREMRMYLKNRQRVFLHPKSINFPQNKYESPWMVFHDKMQTSKSFIMDATMISPYPLLMFGGGRNRLLVNHEQQQISLDEWLAFECPSRIGLLLREIRLELDKLLEDKIKNPSLDISNTILIQAITELIATDGFL